jgi:hypothetical protein
MMEWMIMILVGEMAGGDEDFGSEVGKMRLTFTDRLTANPTQQNPHGPNDHSITINYHHLDISGHDRMNEQDIGWRNGWC